jgi:hypothetical protein
MRDRTESPTKNPPEIEATWAAHNEADPAAATAAPPKAPGPGPGARWAGIHPCSTEAAAAAGALLPPADCICGGDGEPTTLWWRVQASHGWETRSYTDADDGHTCLLELLESGVAPGCCQQTTAGGGPHADVAPDALTAAALDLAAVSWLARHLPRGGDTVAGLRALAGWLLLFQHRPEHVVRLVDALAAALGVAPESSLGAALVKQVQTEPSSRVPEIGTQVPPQVLGWLADADRWWAGHASDNPFRVAEGATPADAARQIDTALRDWGDNLPKGLGDAELSIHLATLQPVIQQAMTVLTADAVTAILDGLARRLRQAGYLWVTRKRMLAWCAAIARKGTSAPATEEGIGEGEQRQRTNTPPHNDGRATPDGANPREPAAVTLVRLAQEAGVELLRQADERTYAAIPRGQHRETRPIRSRQFRAWLAGLYHQACGQLPGSNALADAVSGLDDLALHSGTLAETHLRVAGLGGKIYLDLGDPTWRAVEIDAEGWRVVDAPPVFFRRAKGMLALPEPVCGGSLDELRPFLNVADDDNWRLSIGWMSMSLCPRGPYPLLVLTGAPGAAKSTTGRLIRQLIDPSVPLLRSAPREERDLAIAAQNCWLVAYDNLSSMPPWLSDALCRLATGGRLRHAAALHRRRGGDFRRVEAGDAHQHRRHHQGLRPRQS